MIQAGFVEDTDDGSEVIRIQRFASRSYALCFDAANASSPDIILPNMMMGITGFEDRIFNRQLI
jgi:hypothetical protein